MKTKLTNRRREASVIPEKQPKRTETNSNDPWLLIRNRNDSKGKRNDKRTKRNETKPYITETETIRNQTKRKR